MARRPITLLLLPALLTAGLAALARQGQRAPALGPNDFLLTAAQEPGLMAQLSAADTSWIPRVEPIPGVGSRYVYKRQAGDPPLSVDQVKQLLRDPPRFDQERMVIQSLLEALRRSGVSVVLGPPRLHGAAGEWDPQRRVLRIRPDVPAKGSREFVRVLNHEAIHVAQSCRGRGWFQERPQLLGLSQRLNASAASHLAEPLYATATPHQQALEVEAYANQDQLDLGAQLLAAHCSS
jgi:hypothetical protein